MELNISDPRFKWLTTKQRHIVKIAKNDGEITLREIQLMYSSKQNWSRAISKLITFNILRPNKEKTKFYYIPYESIGDNQTRLL